MIVYDGIYRIRKFRDYSIRLKKFEEEYGMSSEEFKSQFDAGVLGDDPQWFDWLFVFEAYREVLWSKKVAEARHEHINN